MCATAIAIPLVPGQTDAWRAMARELAGPRREEFAGFHQRVGLRVENWYLQRTPGGDLAIVYLEGDIPACFEALARSDHPFERWFKERLLQIEGIDFAEPLPGLPEVLLESSVAPAPQA